MADFLKIAKSIVIHFVHMCLRRDFFFYQSLQVGNPRYYERHELYIIIVSDRIAGQRLVMPNISVPRTPYISFVHIKIKNIAISV